MISFIPYNSSVKSRYDYCEKNESELSSDFTKVTYLESGGVSCDAIYMNCPEKANLCRKERVDEWFPGSRNGVDVNKP